MDKKSIQIVSSSPSIDRETSISIIDRESVRKISGPTKIVIGGLEIDVSESYCYCWQVAFGRVSKAVRLREKVLRFDLDYDSFSIEIETPAKTTVLDYPREQTADVVENKLEEIESLIDAIPEVTRVRVEEDLDFVEEDLESQRRFDAGLDALRREQNACLAWIKRQTGIDAHIGQAVFTDAGPGVISGAEPDKLLIETKYGIIKQDPCQGINYDIELDTDV